MIQNVGLSGLLGEADMKRIGDIVREIVERHEHSRWANRGLRTDANF